LAIAYRMGRAADLERLLPLVEAYARETHAALPLYPLRADFMEQVRAGVAQTLEHPAGCVMLAEAETPGGAATDLAGYAIGMLQEPPGIFRPEPYVFLSDLYVRPEYRRRGIGTALVERVRGWGWIKGVRRFSLVLPVDSPAQALFARLGFIPIQTMLHYQDKDA